MRVKTRLRLDTAGLAHERRGAAHVRGLGRVAGDPQRDVGLDGRREIGRARRRTSPTSRRAAGASGSSRRICASSRRRPGGRGSAAGRGPRRRSSRWSRARPSTSRRDAGARAGVRVARSSALRAASSVRGSAIAVMRATALPLRGSLQRGARGGEPAADGALHRRRPAGVGPRAGEVEAVHLRARAGTQAARAGRDAEGRARLVGDGEVEHGRAARRRQQALERRQVALAQRLDGGADLVDGVRDRDREQLALARARLPPCGRRRTAPASRALPRAARRARGGRSARAG